VYWWIRQAVSRALDNEARLIRLPVHTSELLRKVALAEQRLRFELQREPSTAEVEAEVGMQPDTLAELRARASAPGSLDVPVSEDSDLTRGDLVADDDALLTITTATEAEELSEEVARALELLPDREGDVLRMHFGLNCPAPLTLAEIAKQLGVTRQRVQQLEVQGLRRLRRDGQLRRRLAS
jgi:RNA polymerase sigma factor (sigma-70 family)